MFYSILLTILLEQLSMSFLSLPVSNANVQMYNVIVYFSLDVSHVKKSSRPLYNGPLQRLIRPFCWVMGKISKETLTLLIYSSSISSSFTCIYFPKFCGWVSFPCTQYFVTLLIPFLTKPTEFLWVHWSIMLSVKSKYPLHNFSTETIKQNNYFKTLN